MPSSNFLRNYDLAENTIRKLYDSKLRLAIIDALKDNPMRLADLRRAVNANAPNTSSKAKELEEMGLLEKSEGDFQLTPYGQAIRQRIQETLEFYSTYEKFKEFWETHNTNGIPRELWLRLAELNNSEIVKDTSGSVTESHDKFVLLLKSIKKRFYGVSPIYHDEYLKEVFDKLGANVDSKFIISKEIFEILINLPKGEKAQLKKVWTRGEWFVFEKPLSAAFTVSENFLSLALETKSEPKHHLGADLNSHDPRAIKWGLDLFEYYKKQSKPIKLSDYL
jgi:predicted transcriptional regulator